MANKIYLVMCLKCCIAQAGCSADAVLNDAVSDTTGDQ
jgi:hypothetical protein